MALISRDTAAQIAFAHEEGAAARKLLAELENANIWREEPDFRDAFGRRRGLQLGVPHGQGGHQLYAVTPSLAKYVIEAHIGKIEARIAELCAIARMELDGVAAAPAPGGSNAAA